jgi:hypothetical protein
LAENSSIVVKQPDFFTKYQEKKDEIVELMDQWTELQM